MILWTLFSVVVAAQEPPAEVPPSGAAEAPVGAPPTEAAEPAPEPPPAPATTVQTPAPPKDEGPKCSMAVLDLEAAEGISPQRASTWTDVVVQEMQQHSGCTVLSRADIRAMISLEAEKSLLGCDEQSCLAELGGALGTSHLLTGRISRIQGSVLLSLRKINTKSMAVEARATDSFAGEDDEVFAFVSWLSKKLIFGDDPERVGSKPVPRPKKEQGPQLVERRGTIWRTLAWTGVWLTAGSAVVFTGGAITTQYFSDTTAQAKLRPTNEREFLELAEQVGPVSASVTNGALYAGSALLVATVALFFLPHEEIARVEIGDAQ